MALRLHGTSLALCLALLLGASSGASAQELDAGRARAVQLFRESADAYREGRFDEAATLLREARALHPEPLLAYNLARALEGAGDIEGAVEAYHAYLTEAPDAADAPAVRARLTGLERHLAEIRTLEAEREELRARAESRTLPPPVIARSADSVPWIVVGAGGGVVVVGAVLGGVAIARNGEAQRATTHAGATTAIADAGALATAANVMFVIGGTAALVGAIWGTIDVVSLGGGDASASLRIGPGSIAVHGSF